MSKNKAAAVLTIRRAPDMTKKARHQVASWLRGQANVFECYGKEYAPKVFTARYLYK